jgi:hypothetical protein
VDRSRLCAAQQDRRGAPADRDRDSEADRALQAPPRLRPGPRKAHLERLARRWRALPSLGRLRLATRFEDGRLHIAELRLVPSKIEAAGWDGGEPALAIALQSIKIEPPAYAEKGVLICGIGLHAIARRYERGADRADTARPPGAPRWSSGVALKQHLVELVGRRSRQWHRFELLEYSRDDHLHPTRQFTLTALNAGYARRATRPTPSEFRHPSRAGADFSLSASVLGHRSPPALALRSPASRPAGGKSWGTRSESGGDGDGVDSTGRGAQGTTGKQHRRARPYDQRTQDRRPSLAVSPATGA